MSGGGNEHFCLRWNDFESNISHAFREIRDEKDFFDVTLACEDEQVQAHKVILSACSPFFRKILRKNPHQHPLLFLKGVKYAEIMAILNFMYHGEVNVTQDDLNAFLAVAEELKVKGLTQNDQQKQGSEQQARVQEPPQRRNREPPDAPPPPKKTRTVPETGVAPPPPPHPPVKTEPLAVPEVLLDEPFSGGSMVAQGSKDDLETYDDPNYDYTGYEEEDTTGAQFDASNSHALRPDGNKGDFRDSLLGHMMTKEFRPELGGNVWRCTECDKEHKSKTLIRDHVEAQHFKNIDYSCDHCGKVYKTRDSFKKHVAVHKRNPGFHGRGAYNPAGRTDSLVATGEGQATAGFQ